MHVVATGPMPAANVAVERIPGHWLLAQLGKRVLRPGGRPATRWLLERAAVGRDDDVVELAPGIGATAEVLLAREPRRYVGVERDAAAVTIAGEVVRRRARATTSASVVHGDATSLPLEDRTASLVVGEALLSMLPSAAKERIVGEAARVLVPGGRYAIHELAMIVGDEHGPEAAAIQRDLGRSIHVGVRIHGPQGWQELLRAHGFEIEATKTGPMRLLELDGLLHDEGLIGTARFGWNALRRPGAIERLREMRASFRAHASRLAFVAIVARRRS